MNPSNILIVAGGTGGHISPGIALYEELKEKHNVYFLTLFKNKDYKEFIKKNIQPYYYDAPNFTKNILKLFIKIIEFIKSIYIAIRIIKSHSCHIVIGMGGYPTVPALIASILLNKTIYLCEQNVVPGKVTKIFSPFSKKIFLNFPVNETYINKKSIITGNPIRKELWGQSQTKKHNKTIKTIFITGGSQGAKQINEMIWNLWKQYEEFSNRFYWIIQTGIPHQETFQKEIQNISFYDQIEIFGFTTEMHQYFLKSDLLICRAGAGNLTEGILFSLPMILIPYPYAKDNHQLKNAKFLEKEKSALIINTKTTDPQPLYEALQTMIQNYETFKNQIQKIKFQENPTKIISRYIER